ncbi:MAG: sugar ABC transporter permease, partial [Bauldia sp.]|nr:sugar ABC transporter permease [Bauldia sp.]
MKRESQLSRQRKRAAWLFLTPMLAVLAAVALWPLLKTIYFGFTDASLDDLAGARWIGFRNFLEYVDYGDGTGEYYGLLADPTWWNAVRNTLFFTVVSVVFETILGMIVALVLNANFRGRGFMRAAILIPWAIPTIVSAKMWAWMMHDQFGILNDIGLSLGLISTPIAWTASADTAMAAVIIVDIWKTTPFMALLILAGLQMIPGDIYEAARIDGVNPIKVFWRVTLPLVRPALMVAVIFRGLDSMRIFDLIYVLTPNNAQTTSMSVYARQNLFEFDKFAYGS